MASHTGFSVGRSVVNCADDGLEVGEIDGLGVGDEDEDIIGLAVGYLVGCMQAKKGLKRSQRGCRVNLTFS